LILDGVEKTNNVGVGWKILMPRRDRLESKEQEVPDDVLVVGRFVQTGDDVIHPQLLLGVLQQRDKRSLAPVRQLVLGDHHVEPVLPKHRLPLAPNSADARR